MKSTTGIVPDRIVFDHEGQTITGVAPRTARDMEARGEYPRSRIVNSRRKGRLLSELVDWVRNRPLAPLPEPRQAAHNNDDDETRTARPNELRDSRKTRTVVQ
jgi:hypothetical protein